MSHLLACGLLSLSFAGKVDPRLLLYPPDKLIQRHERDRLSAPESRRNGFLPDLPIADDGHVGDLLKLGFSYLIPKLLVAVVQLQPNPPGTQNPLHRSGV